MKKALIISGGEFSPFHIEDYDYVIACDKGAEYAKRLNIPPDVILGDFDSYEGQIENDWKDVEIIRFPIEKDDTDTMLSIKHALRLGYDHLVLTCVLGRRMDHFLANIQSLHYISEHGAVGEIVAEAEHMLTLNKGDGVITIPKRKGYSLSVFALSDSVRGLFIQGTKYEAENITLLNSFPLGQSNEIVSDFATVSIESGILLIVESKY